MNLFVGALRAAAVTTATTEGLSGIAKIAAPQFDPNDEALKLIDADDEPGWLEKIGNWFKEVVSNPGAWLSSLNPIVLFRKVRAMFYRFIGDNIEFVYNFNWNTTDEELDAQFANLANLVMGQLGGTLGSLWGSIACGGIISAGELGLAKLLKFNDGSAMRIFKEGGEEALDELYDNLRSLVVTMRNAAVSWLMVQAFKGTRRMIKTVLNDPNSWQSRFFKKIAGDGAWQFIKQWGEKGSKPWSFALRDEQKYEELEKKDGKGWSNFWEEFDEEAREACTEQFYIAAGVLDEVAMEKAVVLGVERAVEIYPDRKNKQERIVLAGREELLKPQIIQMIQTNRLVEKKDIGMIIGTALEDKIANLKGIDTKQCDLILKYYDEKEPPFSRQGRPAKDYHVRIPDIIRTKVDDWDLIKKLAGGSNGYTAGGIKVIGILGNEDGLESDKIEVFASSEKEGQDLIKDLIQLTDLKLLYFQAITQSKEGIRGKWLWQNPTKVYPCFFTVINYERIIKEQEGRKPPSGTYLKDKFMFPLWVSKMPHDFKDNIRELLKQNASFTRGD